MNKNTISKWFSMFLLMMVAGITGATAQSLTVADFTLEQGQMTEVNIKLAAPADQTIYGVQTDITLSEGLILEEVAAVNAELQFDKNIVAGGATRVALLSLAGASIPAGDVIKLHVKAADTFAGGTIALTNSKLTTSTAGAEINIENSTANVTKGVDPLVAAKEALQTAIAIASNINPDGLADAIAAAQNALRAEDATAASLASAAQTLEGAIKNYFNEVLPRLGAIVGGLNDSTLNAAYANAQAALAKEDVTPQELAAAMQQIITTAQAVAPEHLQNLKGYAVKYGAADAVSLVDNALAAITSGNVSQIIATMAAVNQTATPLAQKVLGGIIGYVEAFGLTEQAAQAQAALESGNYVTMITVAKAIYTHLIAAAKNYLPGLAVITEGLNDSTLNAAYANAQAVLANENVTPEDLGTAMQQIIVAAKAVAPAHLQNLRGYAVKYGQEGTAALVDSALVAIKAGNVSKIIATMTAVREAATPLATGILQQMIGYAQSYNGFEADVTEAQTALRGGNYITMITTAKALYAKLIAAANDYVASAKAIPTEGKEGVDALNTAISAAEQALAAQDSDFSAINTAISNLVAAVKAFEEANLVIVYTATFNFADSNFREKIGTAMADVDGFIYNETFTAEGATLQITAGSAPSRIYTDANRGQCLVLYNQYGALSFKAPEGKAITKIEFTAAGNSNINKLTASSGAIEGMTWTGNAEGVRFTQGATSYLANAVLTLVDKTAETAALPAIEYTECANIAAFNALAAGTYAKITLTNAEVIGKSADGYSTVWMQDATGGCWIQYTSLNDKLTEKTKVNGTVYAVLRATSGNTQMKEAEATLQSELNATAIESYTAVAGTIAEVNVAANLNKVVKIAADSLVMTKASSGTLYVGETSITVNNGTATANQLLCKIADWEQGKKLENITIEAILSASSATANQLLPISITENAPAPEKFAIMIAETENGSAVAEPTEAAAGETVKVTVTPAEGYKVDEASIVDAAGNVIEFQIIDETHATFVMPASAVKINFTFKETSVKPIDPASLQRIAKKAEMTGEVTSLTDLETSKFMLQNEAGLVLYTPDGWDVKVADIVTASSNKGNGGFFTLVALDGDHAGQYQVPIWNLDGSRRTFWAGEQYLNAQPGGNVIFGLDGTAPNYGQDGTNLALWTIAYEANKGFAFHCVGRDIYLGNDNAAARPSDTAVYWRAYTGYIAGYDEAEILAAYEAVASVIKTADDAAALATAKSVYDSDKDLNKFGDAVNAAIDVVKACVALNEAYGNLDATGAPVAAEALAKYNAGEYANVAALQAAYYAAAKAQTTAGANMTLAIVNPSFEDGTINGWTSDNCGGVANNYNFGTRTGDKFCERWTGAPGTLSDGSFLQTITGLPNGKYILTAEMQNREQGNGDAAGHGFFLVANEGKTEGVTNDGETIKTVGVVTDGTLVIGVKLEGCTGNWICFDNFQLTYSGALATETELAELTAEIAIAKTLNVDVKEYENGAFTATEVPAAVEALKVDEYNQVNKDYTINAAVLIPDFSQWTGDMVSNMGQHWDGTSTSVYYEQTSAQWSQNSWTNNKTTTVKLPKGKYVLYAAGRASAGTACNAYIKVNNLTRTYTSKGDVGFGVATDGTASFDPNASYANNGKGRGFEYRYIAFEVTADEGEDISLEIGGEATAAHQWMSFTAPVLVTTEDNAAIMLPVLTGKITAAKADLEAIKGTIGEDLFMKPQAAYDEYAAAVAAADSIVAAASPTAEAVKNALADIDAKAKAFAEAPVKAPATDKEYVITNKTANLALSIGNEAVKIEKEGLVKFTKVEGGWILSNNAETPEYIFKTTANNWTFSTTVNKDEAYVVNFNIADGAYTIQGAKGLFGTDNTAAGSAVYANKAQTNNGLWLIAEYVAPPVDSALIAAKAALQAIINADKTIVTEGQQGADAFATAITTAEAAIDAADATVESIAAARAALASAVATFTKANLGSEFVEIEQTQSPEISDGASRATVVEGDGYTQYTTDGGVCVIIKKYDIDVKDCDYVTIKFAEPLPNGINAAFWAQSGTDNVGMPAGTYEYKYVFADDAKCAIANDVLPQLTLLTLWNSQTVNIVGVYKHKNAIPELAQTLNVERYAGLGYTAQEATVDFTEAKTFLGVEAITTDMLRIVNPDGTQISDYAPFDGWFNGEGAAETWGANTKVCVKFFQAIPEGKFEICDMNGADSIGATYTVKWALVANDKQVTYTINVKFVEKPVIDLKFADLSVKETKTVTLTSELGKSYEGLTADVDVAAILAKLEVASLDDLTIYAVQTDGSLDDNYKLGTTDGWRDSAGNWQTWGDAAYFYVKADFSKESAQIYDAGGMDGKNTIASWKNPFTYTATYAFVKTGSNDAVVLKVTLRYTVPTGINAIARDAQKNVIFNLNGQKVNKAQKGLFIINGKKVVNK